MFGFLQPRGLPLNKVIDKNRSLGMAKEYPLVEELQNNFIATDNIQRDDKLERSILTHAKASFLLEANAAKTDFRRFFRNDKLKNGNNCYVFPLKKPIIITQNSRGSDYKIIFREFEVQTKDAPIEDAFGQIGRWRIVIHQNYSDHLEEQIISADKWRIQSKDLSLKIFPYDQIDLGKGIKQAIIKFSKKSFFELCQHLTRYNTPEKCCRFLGNEWNLFSPLKLTGNSYKEDYFDDLVDSDELRGFEAVCANYPSFNEEDFVESLLENFIFRPLRKSGISKKYDRYFTPIKEVYSYVDQYAGVKMKVIRLFNPERQKKILIPVTSWLANYQSKKHYRCVLLTKKQILYNLNLIEKESTSRIIIADSIEIADANQKKAPRDTVWTSFLCEHEQYDQVDWEPLKGGHEIFLLITNHSRISLTEAYLKAHKLASFLKEKIKLELKFIQVQVDFLDSQNFYFKINPDIKSDTPRIIPNSVFIMDSFDEFAEYHEKAVEWSQKRPRQFWEKENSDCGVIEQDDHDDVTMEAIPFLFRPIIIRGTVGIGHAPSGHGKTSFFMSMCAAIVSGKEFIIGKSWNVVKKDSYKYRKVLYLDFESDEAGIKSRQTRFVNSYFPTDKEDRNKCKNNLIIKALKHDDTNYSDKENHKKIINMIDDATKNNGEKGQPIDLIVFDTYERFIKIDDRSSWLKIEDLINKINERNTAVFFVAHTLEDESNMAGAVQKKRICTTEIKIVRKNIGGTLADSMSIQMKKTRYGVIEQEVKEFAAHFINKKWRLCGVKNKALTKEELEKAGLEDFKISVEQYKDSDFKVSTIWEMMGVGSSSYYVKLDKIKEVLNDEK